MSSSSYLKIDVAFKITIGCAITYLMMILKVTSILRELKKDMSLPYSITPKELLNL
jgi:hypothetical protein